MIHWLVQSAAIHPDLRNAQAPADLLTPAEEARLATLRTPKRRRDWLLGRWTAKLLTQRYLAAAGGPRTALAAIEIVNDDDGAPYVRLIEAGTAGARRLDVCLTISHCHETALCALTAANRKDEAGVLSIGCDIEHVEPREANFVETFYTPDEIRQVKMIAPAWRDTLVTAIWSAKEAALKVVRRGLTVDTRRVNCQFDLATLPDGDWRPLRIAYQPEPLGQSEEMQGWWTLHGPFVLALAAGGFPTGWENQWTVDS